MASQTKQNTIETKGLILDAAKKQFSVLGFSKVTMEEIAAEAGMGKASLYYYFTDKDSLFQAVVKEEMQNFEEFIEWSYQKISLLRKKYGNMLKNVSGSSIAC